MTAEPSLRLWYSGFVACTLTAVGLLCLVLFTWSTSLISQPASSSHPMASSTPTPLPSTPAFAYEYATHGSYHALSDEQCEIAFPRLYEVLDDTAAARKDSPINETELHTAQEKCLVRVLIYEAELFIVYGTQNSGCWMHRWHERTSGFLHSINRAITGSHPNTIPNVEFLLDLDDDPERPIAIKEDDTRDEVPVWGLTRQPHQKHIWLVPDYAYWAWPSARVGSHIHTRRKMDEMNVKWPWTAKIRKVIWRGTTHLNTVIREALIHTTQDKPWADVRICDIFDAKTKQYCIFQHEHCRYEFTIHTEGYTYSGRLKYLQLCNSVPIVHELKWAEHHTHLLQPNGSDQNYVRVRRDWADLEDKVQHYLDHDDEARQIAQTSYDTFSRRYLTPAAVSCYWRRLIRTWASVQGFEPQLYEPDPLTGENVLRGVPFEAYAINAKKPMPVLD